MRSDDRDRDAPSGPAEVSFCPVRFVRDRRIFHAIVAAAVAIPAVALPVIARYLLAGANSPFTVNPMSTVVIFAAAVGMLGAMGFLVCVQSMPGPAEVVWGVEGMGLTFCNWRRPVRVSSDWRAVGRAGALRSGGKLVYWVRMYPPRTLWGTTLTFEAEVYRSAAIRLTAPVRRMAEGQADLLIRRGGD